MGGGTFLPYYRQRVTDYGLADRFVFVDYVPYEQLPDYYRKFSLFVAPVWKESFGQVSPFAMSMEIPVVGYDVGALSEILDSKDCLGKDTAELTDIIINLLDDRKKRLDIGKANRARVIEKFSVDAMIRQYDDSLCPAVGAKKNGACRSMRILFPVHVFFPTHFYGTETYTLELAKNLQSMGHDAVILTATPYGEPGAGTESIRSTPYDGLTVHCLDLNLIPHRRFKDTYYRPEMHELLRDVVSDIDPDLVHVTHLINLTATLLDVLREMQIPTMATFH